MDYLGKGEVLTNTDLDRFVKNFWEKWAFCVQSVAFSILFSVYIYMNPTQYKNLNEKSTNKNLLNIIKLLEYLNSQY